MANVSDKWVGISFTGLNSGWGYIRVLDIREVAVRKGKANPSGTPPKWEVRITVRETEYLYQTCANEPEATRKVNDLMDRIAKAEKPE